METYINGEVAEAKTKQRQALKEARKEDYRKGASQTFRDIKAPTSKHASQIMVEVETVAWPARAPLRGKGHCGCFHVECPQQLQTEAEVKIGNYKTTIKKIQGDRIQVVPPIPVRETRAARSSRNKAVNGSSPALHLLERARAMQIAEGTR